jgi:hypothetical protein
MGAYNLKISQIVKYNDGCVYIIRDTNVVQVGTLHLLFDVSYSEITSTKPSSSPKPFFAVSSHGNKTFERIELTDLPKTPDGTDYYEVVIHSMLIPEMLGKLTVLITSVNESIHKVSHYQRFFQ